AGDAVEVEVPGFRVDVEREVDLIEEIVRVQGYDRVGSSLPRGAQAGGRPEPYAFARRLKDVLAAAGLHEIRPAPFASREDLSAAGGADGAHGGGGAVVVANPLRAEEAYLRTSLLPGLAHAVARNLDLGVRSIGLFEVGRVFGTGRVPDEPFEERRVAAFVLAGPAEDRWYGSDRPFDVLDARGVLESTLDAVGVTGWSLGDAPGRPFHPGRSARVLLEGEPVGVVGELHPAVAAAFDVDGRVAVCELDVDALIAGARKEFRVREVPRVPPVRRDLAFVLPSDAPAGEVRAALEEAAGELFDDATLFDVYEGPPLPDGRKSLAFAVAFRAEDRTLESEEVQPAVDRIAAAIAERFGGELRSG
ncbi:MAG TPA: phenylalanine--tRNA ligase subunit beta, partial [Actinomycetota bacterium]